MAKKARSGWLRRHLEDKYVKQSKRDGYRSRAAYKLLEIQRKDNLIRPGMIVVDLGAAPGGWAQVAADLVGAKGQVIALDILPMEPFAGVTFIQGDFREQAVFERLLRALAGAPVDVVVSDMAPNLTGQRAVDQPRAMYLAELALDFATRVLRPGGAFLTKAFQGEGIDAYRRQMRADFDSVLTRKPDASRSQSREFYLLGKGRIVH